MNTGNNISSDYEISSIDPETLMESIRAFGYSPQASIADLIDNSISAGSKNIWIKFIWRGKDSFVEILDDGSGMSLAELQNAMKIGSKSPTLTRDSKDLGRFGLGLKTASFAQCRRLTVATVTDEKEKSIRVWDLDVVAQTGELRLLTDASEDTMDSINENLYKSNKSGTIVRWDLLDKMVGDIEEDDEVARKVFFDTAESIKLHISMVFHRFFTGPNKIKIFLGNDSQPVLPWDPFMEDEEMTMRLEQESLKLFENSILVRPFVLPHHTNISEEKHSDGSGIKGWNAHQGFYIYRNRRLLVSGSWLGLRQLKQEEHTKLARIQIDLPNSLDKEWEIDVKKSEARPPSGIRNDLARIATATRKHATEVYRFRGKSTSRQKAMSFDFIWDTKSLRGNRFTFKIRRNHPLIKKLKMGLNRENFAELDDVLKIIEETIPVNHFWVQQSENPDAFSQNFEDFSERDLLKLFANAFGRYVQMGMSRSEALNQLRNHEGFSAYPEILGLLLEKESQNESVN